MQVLSSFEEKKRLKRIVIITQVLKLINTKLNKFLYVLLSQITLLTKMLQHSSCSVPGPSFYLYKQERVSSLQTQETPK